MLILKSDISTRKIPNKLLLILLLFFPFWYFLVPEQQNIYDISHIIPIILIGIGSILLYRKDNSLGAGDIKYILVLLIFLGQKPLAFFIGNMGILTISVLALWWAITLGQIYAMRKRITKKERILFSQEFTKEKIQNSVLIFVFDWIVMGIPLSFALKDIASGFFSTFPSLSDTGNFYFLLSLSIFFLRPGFRYVFLLWEHRIFPIFGMLIYIGFIGQRYGWTGFIGEIGLFLSNIWLYAIIFVLLYTITQKTFFLYDMLVEKKTENSLHTIPYSVIIFLGFSTLFFFHMNLTEIIWKILAS